MIRKKNVESYINYEKKFVKYTGKINFHGFFFIVDIWFYIFSLIRLSHLLIISSNHKAQWVYWNDVREWKSWSFWLIYLNKMDSPIFFFLPCQKLWETNISPKIWLKIQVWMCIISKTLLLCPKICSKSTVIEVFPKLPTKYAWYGQKHPMKKCFKMPARWSEA